MRKLTIRNTNGSLAVSAGVVREIAQSAAIEVEGVAGIAPSVTQYHKKLFSGKVQKDPVQVKMNEGVALVKVAILLKPDAKADVVSQKVQKDIKQAVQSMTGIAVTQVDVFVADVVFNGE